MIKKRIRTGQALSRAAETAEFTPAFVPAATAPRGGWRFAAYLCSLFPAVGLCLGLLFAPSPDAGNRRFGRICLVLAVAGFILGALLNAFNISGVDGGEKFIESFY
jgi:hypothetical protein